MFDIAQTVHQEKMRTEADGRRTFQQVYLWMRDHKNKKSAGNPRYERDTTTEQYQPDIDGPSYIRCPILPQNEELVDHDDAELYLEVGIIMGADPSKSAPKGMRNKQTGPERQRRRIMMRRPGAMRVFIPVTENIAPQAQFYVGCRMSRGRLHPRIIDQDSVFFYAEFWRGIRDDLNVESRRAELATACRRAAVVNKSPSGNMADPNAFGNTHDGATATLVPAKQPHDSTPTAVRSKGSDAFFNFDRPLSSKDAQHLAWDLRRANPHIDPLLPELIQSMHKVLCTGSSGPMGNQLSPKTLGTLDFFIRDCQDRIPDDYELNAVIGKAVCDTLNSVSIIMENPFWKKLPPSTE